MQLEEKRKTMIFKFNSAVFNSLDKDFQKALRKIFLDFLDDHFLWDMENLTDLFLNDENDVQILEDTSLWKNLGKHLQNEIAEHIFLKAEQSAYITNQKKFYLSTIIIGEDEGEVNPIYAYKIINEKSLVVIENNLNDWNFISGVIKNYTNYSNKKNIYKVVKKAIDDNRLQPRGFGGGGEIKKNLEVLVNKDYKYIYKYKLATLFDSDRNSSDEVIKNDVYNRLVFLKGRNFDKTKSGELRYSSSDILRWHMLYKREIENYIPLHLIYSTFPSIDENNQEKLNNLEKEELDFYNFGEITEVKKNESSKIFLTDSIRESLTLRCEHHKVTTETQNNILEEIDELEKIILMLAKIV